MGLETYFFACCSDRCYDDIDIVSTNGASASWLLALLLSIYVDSIMRSLAGFSERAGKLLSRKEERIHLNEFE